jgi:hypothetical protein
LSLPQKSDLSAITARKGSSSDSAWLRNLKEALGLVRIGDAEQLLRLVDGDQDLRFGGASLDRD